MISMSSFKTRRFVRQFAGAALLSFSGLALASSDCCGELLQCCLHLMACCF